MPCCWWAMRGSVPGSVDGAVGSTRGCDWSGPACVWGVVPRRWASDAPAWSVGGRGELPSGGESERLVVESPWSQFTSECSGLDTHRDSITSRFDGR
jgi:hypothetical protein